MLLNENSIKIIVAADFRFRTKKRKKFKFIQDLGKKSTIIVHSAVILVLLTPDHDKKFGFYVFLSFF